MDNILSVQLVQIFGTVAILGVIAAVSAWLVLDGEE